MATTLSKGNKVVAVASTASAALVKAVTTAHNNSLTNGPQVPISTPLPTRAPLPATVPATIEDVTPDGKTVTVRLPDGLATGGTRTYSLPASEWTGGGA